MGDILKISRVSLFLFIVIYNFLFLRIVIFPHLYDNFGNNGIIYILVIIASFILGVLFLPKRIFNIDFNKKYKESKFKYFFNFLLFLRIIIGISLCGYVLNNIFFYDYKYWIIILGIIGVIVLLSFLKTNEIIELSTLFGFVVLACYMLFIYFLIDLDYKLIFKDFSFKFDLIVFILPFLLTIDNSIILLTNKEGLTLSKYNIIGGVVLALFLFGLEYLLLGLSSGDKIFYNDELVGFYSLGIEAVTRHNGNYNFVYIVMIVVSGIFKFSYFLSIINKTKNINGYKYFLYFFIILFACIGLFFVINNYLNYLKFFILIVLLISSLVWFWFLKEFKNAKKI